MVPSQNLDKDRAIISGAMISVAKCSPESLLSGSTRFVGYSHGFFEKGTSNTSRTVQKGNVSFCELLQL